MGIPKFARFLMSRYPLILRKIKGNVDVPEIDNLYLDINGIIHNVSHNNDIITACMNKSNETIYQDACNIIHSIISLIKPKKFVMISADGVAPRAKMNQQRSRRFRKETIPQEAKELLIEQGLDTQNMFDSNCISAGTEFMFNLSLHMNKYIEEQKKKDKLWQSLTVLFSGSDVPGEGEHKILEYIRNYKSSPQYQINTKHCIYGLDADLIMLSLITHEPNIVILREDTFLKKKKKESTSHQTNSKDEYYEFILVSVLREYLELEFLDVTPKLKFKFNLERIIDDFIFFCFFIGNDFLPNLNSLDIETGALEHIFTFYKKCLPTFNDYITFHGKIDFSKAKGIFKMLAFQEKKSLGELVESIRDSVRENKIRKKILIKEKYKEVKEKEYTVKKGKLYNSLKQKGKNEINAFKRNKKNKTIKQLQTIYESKVKSEKTFKEEVDIYYNTQDLLKKENEKKINETIVGLFDGEDEFKRKPPKRKTIITEKSTPQEILDEAISYKKYIDDDTYCSDLRFEEMSDSDVSEIDKKEILEIVMNLDEIKEPFQIDGNNETDIEDVNKKFMETLHNYVVTDINRAKEFYYKEKLHFDINTEEGKNEKEKMFVKYLEGLQWVLYYYYRGIKSWKWYYPYHYAPLISDFVDYEYSQKALDELFLNDNTKPFEPFLSLLFILPKSSFNLLPSCYHVIPDELNHLYPLTYEIDYNGKRTPWESLTLIPFLDENVITEIEQKYSNLTEEEKQRNKWGDSFLYGQNTEIPEIKKQTYSIYQLNDPLLKSNYELKKTDCTFPTLSSIIYDYSTEEFKLYFGKSCRRTNRIYIFPITSYKTFTDDNIYHFLTYPYIFVNYPYKTNAKLLGFVYQKKYFYLFKGEPCIDSDFKLSEELVTKIDNEHYKKGIRITFKDILCNVVLFKGLEVNKNGKVVYVYEDEKNAMYVPFEITSLNYKSGEMKVLKKRFDDNIKQEQDKENVICEKHKQGGDKEKKQHHQQHQEVKGTLREVNQNLQQQNELALKNKQVGHMSQQQIPYNKYGHQYQQQQIPYNQYGHQYQQQQIPYNQYGHQDQHQQQIPYNQYGQQYQQKYQNYGYGNKYEENEGKKRIIRNQVKINKKFKTFPEELEIQETEKKVINPMMKNVSEYREKRIFENEKLNENQLFYFPINENEIEDKVKQNTNIIIRNVK